MIENMKISIGPEKHRMTSYIQMQMSINPIHQSFSIWASEFQFMVDEDFKISAINSTSKLFLHLNTTKEFYKECVTERCFSPLGNPLRNLFSDGKITDPQFLKFTRKLRIK